MHPKASFLRIIYMRSNNSSLPPKDLFPRIIKRLGLEKELSLVKRYAGFFSVLLIVFIVLSIFAFIGVKSVLKESGLLPFLSLIVSDPFMVVKYWDSFLFLVFESAPGFALAGLIFSFAFTMLFARFVFFAIDKISNNLKLIAKQKYGNK